MVADVWPLQPAAGRVCEARGTEAAREAAHQGGEGEEEGTEGIPRYPSSASSGK